MKRYIGFFMVVVGAVAVWDAMFGTNPSTPTVVGLLVMLVIVPGALLARKPKARD